MVVPVSPRTMKRRSFNWTLPPEIEARLGETSYGRQRAILGAGHLLVILHVPPSQERTERDSIVLLRSPDGRWMANGFEGGDARLRKLLGEYRSRLESLEEEYERASTADQLFPLIEGLGRCQRSCSHMAEALQSARDLVKEDRFLISVRDEAYELARGFELLLADGRLKFDYQMARSSELNGLQAGQMAQAQHRLNVLAAVGFPLLAVASLLGMNVRHGLEDRQPWVFWGVLALGAALGLGVRSWVVRR